MRTIASTLGPALLGLLASVQAIAGPAERPAEDEGATAKRSGETEDDREGKQGDGKSTGNEADDPVDDSKPERKLPAVIEKAIAEKEKEVVGARKEGIRLLEDFLRSSPKSRETAEALYKLAELYWEGSKATYLKSMGHYQGAVTACRQDRSTCPRVPRRPPRLDLSQAQGVYDRLIQEYPRFRKIDTVIYLYAFSLRDQGRLGDSIKYFQSILDRFPRSRFIADAWMAVAEFRFYEQQNYKSSLAAYEKVLEHPKSSLYDLALFKTAWCYWKLGDTNKSAQRFKDVLDLAKKKAGKTSAEQKRAEELQGQAMEYLVELFTEDDTKSAQDAFEFLAQIGGKEYSRKILSRLAETVFDQTRYERAAEAYRLLNTLDPNGVDAPDHQKRVVECLQMLGDAAGAVNEMRRLAADYGPRSSWATANKDRPKALAHARQIAEEQIRTLAKSLHAEAQSTEKHSKVVDKERYLRAAEAYEFYLANFPDAVDAIELRYFRADILYFKLGRLADAGNEYLAVGKSKPPGKYHKDALLQAMTAFEKLRKPAGGGKREITESDRKFADAADIYATLFPKDKEIVTVIYKNGQFFFDYGDYDEAVKRFGLIVEGHPDDPNAGAAGDRILEALSKAKDYENIEHWARRLKKTKPFAAKSEQDRLDRMIVVAVMKSGEKYVAQGKFARAAEFFMRVPREYPRDPKAPQALHNAATIFERGKKPEEAVAAYKELAEKYPQAAEAPDALFTAAHIEESIASYDRAAVLYEQVVIRFPQSKHAAESLRNAGVLRQTLGENEKAIQHFGDYARRYKDRGDAKELAFQVAVVRERQQDWKSAAHSFDEYVRAHPGDGRTVEALTRAGDAHLKAGNDGKAKETLARALASAGKKGSGGETRYWAAQARYLQGELIFHDYERLKIAGRPKQLARVLDEKAKLLEQCKQIYLDVVTYQSPEWATAALLRIGQGYEAFAKSMRNAPVPKDLNAEEKQVYRDELEKLTVVIEDKAIDAYKSGYAKALDIGVYNKHTQLIRQALNRLDEANYPKELEIRAGLRAGEPTLRIGKLEEVRRDR